MSKGKQLLDDFLDKVEVSMRKAREQDVITLDDLTPAWEARERLKAYLDPPRDKKGHWLSQRLSKTGADDEMATQNDLSDVAKRSVTKSLPKAPSKRWRCDLCGERLKLKRDLVEHVKDEVEGAYQELSIAEGQLEDLGVKSYDLA